METLLVEAKDGACSGVESSLGRLRLLMQQCRGVSRDVTEWEQNRRLGKRQPSKIALPPPNVGILELGGEV